MNLRISNGLRAIALGALACVSAFAMADSHGVKRTATAVATAEVVALDRADRNVTLKGPRGNVVVIEAGDEVKNFDQIEVGDMVKVTYMESVAVYIGEPGFMPEAKAGVMAGRAAEGEKPAGAVVEAVDVAASVMTIDRNAREVMLLLADGSTTTVDVHPDLDETFKKLQIGDKVHARITRAFAISVERHGAN